MSIICKDLTYIYMPGSPFEAIAIDGISLEIADGEFVGLIGHTGSGKTTLIQHFNGLLKPTSGSVMVAGINTAQSKLHELRKKVGLVFQFPEYQLFEETIYKDVAFGPKNMGCSDEEIDQRVSYAMEAVGLNLAELHGHSPFELSGGQQRRLALAGVLAMRPEILVLDEPTAGLDPGGREDILNLLNQLRSTCTIIMISHDMDVIARMCDRVLVMSKGKLIMNGTPKAVFSQPDKLREVDLGCPISVLLAEKIKQKGYDLEDTPLSIQQLQDLILQRLGKGAV